MTENQSEYMETPLKAYKASVEAINYVEFLLIKRIKDKLPFNICPIYFPKKNRFLAFWGS